MYSITQLFFFVKNFTLTEQSVETLRTDVPKGNDGIPVSNRVARYLKPQNHFCNGILFDNLLDYQRSMRLIAPQDEVRITKYPRQILHKLDISARVPFFNVSDLLCCNNDLVCLNVI